MSGNDTIFMKRALALARRGRTSPNPMVGAVVVRDGAIIGEGFHPKAGEPHAEIFALRAAGLGAKGADLFVTLEPCSHYGRTPPCTEAIINSGIRRVFAAMIDPNPQVAGKGIKALQRAHIETSVGLLESETRSLNEGYIKRVTTGLPFVLWKTAMTLDGKISTRTGNSRWVTGEEARKEVHRLRGRYDAVLVGAGTVKRDDPELTVRHYKGTHNPLRVVVDSNASVPLDARVLNSDAETIIAVIDTAPSEKIEALRDAGARVLVLPEVAGRVDLRALVIDLVNLGVNSILLESGGELAASMLDAGLVDRGLIFVAPKIVGGRTAGTPVGGEGVELMDQALEVSTPRMRRFGNDLALEVEIGNHKTGKKPGLQQTKDY